MERSLTYIIKCNKDVHYYLLHKYEQLSIYSQTSIHWCMHKKNCLEGITWACYHGDFGLGDLECAEGHFASLIVFFYIIWIFQTWPWHVLIRNFTYTDYLKCEIVGIFAFLILYIG